MVLEPKNMLALPPKKNNNKVLKCDLCHIFYKSKLLQLKHDKSFIRGNKC